MWALQHKALGQLVGDRPYRTKRCRARNNNHNGATACPARLLWPHGRMRRCGRLSLKLLGSSTALALVARSDAALPKSSWRRGSVPSTLFTALGPNAPMRALELKDLGQLDEACLYRTRRYRAHHKHLAGATACRVRLIRPHGRMRRCGRLSLKLLSISMVLASIARGDTVLVITVLTARQRAEHS